MKNWRQWLCTYQMPPVCYFIVSNELQRVHLIFFKEISAQPSKAGPARTLKLNRVWKKSTAIDSVDKQKKVTVVKKKVQSSGSKEKIKM